MKYLITLATCAILLGCDVVETANVSNGAGITLFSKTPSNTPITAKQTEDGVIVCDRMGADAVTQTSDGFSFGGKNEALSAGENELTGRSPAVLAQRDALYSLCISRLNGSITDAQYFLLFEKLTLKYADVLKNEANNTQIAISQTTGLSHTQPVVLDATSSKSTDSDDSDNDKDNDNDNDNDNG